MECTAFTSQQGMPDQIYGISGGQEQWGLHRTAIQVKKKYGIAIIIIAIEIKVMVYLLNEL